MLKTIYIMMFCLVISSFGQFAFADETEAEEVNEKPVVMPTDKPEAISVSGVITALPDDFFIVGKKDICPKDLQNTNGTLNLAALDCNSPYRFKALPVEQQRAIILRMRESDWSTVTNQYEGDYVSSEGKYSVSFNRMNSSFADTIKKNYESFARGCKPKKFKGGAKGIQCSIKF